ncbi:MAG: hypothetical protein QOF60_315 [Actinomycetota bacterium]|jgi:uncharacterized protein (TIGR03083 family)|nr:hypothetical protein [Actinomycetota bacterium]
MALPRNVVVPGMQAEYASFAGLLKSLSADEWTQATRCDGWSVADIAAHVTGTLTDVVNFRLEGLGTPEVTARQVDERRGRAAAEVADELEQSAKLGADVLTGFDDAAWETPLAGGLQGTLGFGVETLWYDTFVHGDDIRAAIGRASVVEADGLRPSLSHIAQILTDQGWRPSILAFGELGEFPVSGGGAPISADPLAFVLAATGRGDTAALGLDDTVNIYRE